MNTGDRARTVLTGQTSRRPKFTEDGLVVKLPDKKKLTDPRTDFGEQPGVSTLTGSKVWYPGIEVREDGLYSGTRLGSGAVER